MPIVGIAERLTGTGSRQTVITGAGQIIQFYSNFTNNSNDPTYESNVIDPNYVNDTYYEDRTAVVENLIVDGLNQAGTTGLYLRNLGNAFIRNITIKNCDVGIHLHNAKGAWTETNHLQHIRMENVKTGILFSTDGYFSSEKPGDSFGHSHIDDVSIVLRNTPSAVGIQIGDGQYGNGGSGVNSSNWIVVAKPYFSFIKADIWFGSADSCGVKLVNGELKHCLVNIGVHGKGTGAGTGLDLTGAVTSSYSPIEKNQRSIPSTNMDGFMLRTENLKDPVKYGNWSNKTDVKTVAI
ncbi:MAG: hypothetical protein FWD52_02000 [Candidatus Bathyarchaeota archaeon]|nr:hypothetical protein [Candidatus Termiticorpusculum sp.]